MDLETLVHWGLIATMAVPTLTPVQHASTPFNYVTVEHRQTGARFLQSESQVSALEDIQDLRRPDAYMETETQVPAAALDAGSYVVRALPAEAVAPEVSALEDGVLALLWRTHSGIVSLEIGGSSYGLVAVSDGTPIYLNNGAVDEITSVAFLTLRRLLGFEPDKTESVSHMSFKLNGLLEAGPDTEYARPLSVKGSTPAFA
jgi:hypothetical protein